MCLTTDTGFISQNIFFRSAGNFDIFCTNTWNTPEENVIKYMLQFGIMPTSEFLYVITNHATDAIKTVVHTVNRKFGK